MFLKLEEMPILQEYSEKIGPDYFKGINILYINHIISDSLMVARALKNGGATLWIVGIPYGSIKSDERERVIKGFMELGTLTIPAIDIPLEFSQKMKKEVKNMLLKIGAHCFKKSQRFMIVEDGGYAFPMLHDDSSLKPFLKYCLGASEHTARGMWNYQFLDTDGASKIPRTLEKPAITVASSRLKEKHEPFFVAQAIIDEMGYLLRKKHQFYNFRKMILLGAGRVGKGLAKILMRMNAQVTVVDQDKSKLSILKDEIKQVNVSLLVTDDMLKTHSIIVGATGTASLSSKHVISFLNSTNEHLILVSASSKEIEFREIMIAIENFMRNPDKLKSILKSSVTITKKQIPEYGIIYSFDFGSGKRKQMTILADGYPVIFYPKMTHGASNRVMDPIMSELFLAACFLKTVAKSLDNAVYVLEDLKNKRLPNGPWLDLVNETNILDKWCGYNNIQSESYKRQIGFD